MPRDIRQVQPIPQPRGWAAAKPVKGAALFPYLYGSLALLGRTASGKTTILRHMLRHTVDERTTVYVFCSTLDVDPAWQDILKVLKRLGATVVTYDSMFETDDRGRRRNIVPELVARMNGAVSAAADEAKRPAHAPRGPCLFDDVRSGRPKPKSYHDQTARHVVIFDDLDRAELRSPVLANLVKKNRHVQARVYILSQHPIHLQPDCAANLSQIWLGESYSDAYLQRFFSSRLNSVPDLRLADFLRLYHEAIAVPHRFLVCDQRDNTFHFNFGPPVVP